MSSACFLSIYEAEKHILRHLLVLRWWAFKNQGPIPIPKIVKASPKKIFKLRPSEGIPKKLNHMNRQSALSAIRHAFFCGVLSTIITSIFSTVALLHGSFEVSGTSFSVWLYLDAIILLGLTIGLYFKSRVAAVAIGIYFFWSKHGNIPAAEGAGSWIGYSTSIAFLYFYIHAARAGLFLIREDRKTADRISVADPQDSSGEKR